MITVQGARRADVGRAAMVCLASTMLLLDVGALLGRAMPGTTAGALRYLDALLTCACYALIIWGYLRRGPATASAGMSTGSAVAVIATFMPFSIPALHGSPPGVPGQVTADVLLAVGTAWSAWSLCFLGQNLSVIAQAREVADRGPYRLVRHPLYAGEIVSTFGLALATGSAAAFAIWLAFAAMQVHRARCEERVLLATLPGYRDYRARTAALLPGIF